LRSATEQLEHDVVGRQAIQFYPGWWF
jgi:hypothetical protein